MIDAVRDPVSQAIIFPQNDETAELKNRLSNLERKVAQLEAQCMLRVGTRLYGYCGGRLGDNYETKRVEAIGADWVVARGESTGNPVFFNGDPESLEEYMSPSPEDDS